MSKASIPSKVSDFIRLSMPAVSLPPNPSSKGSLPSTIRTIVSRIKCCSSSVNVGVSAVVPNTQRKFTPASILLMTKRSIAPKSTLPSPQKGVTRAVPTPQSPTKALFLSILLLKLSAKVVQPTQKNKSIYLFCRNTRIESHYTSPIILRNCCSSTRGMPSESAFSRLAGPMFSPAKIKEVFEEIDDTFVPP